MITVQCRDCGANVYVGWPQRNDPAYCSRHSVLKDQPFFSAQDIAELKAKGLLR